METDLNSSATLLFPTNSSIEFFPIMTTYEPFDSMDNDSLYLNREELSILATLNIVPLNESSTTNGSEPKETFSKILTCNTTSEVVLEERSSKVEWTKNVTYLIASTLVFPPYIRVLFTSFCVLVLVVGVLGNLLVPVVLMRNKDMQNSTNLFLLNLSLADLLVLLVCLPTAFVELHSPPDVWLLGEGMCKAVRYVEYTVVHGSVLSLVAISLERYYVVCRPLQVSYLCTKTRANHIIFVIWVTALASASPMLWIQSYDVVPYHDGSLQPVCLTLIVSLWAYAFIYGASLLFFFLPLLLLITVYSIITRQLLKDPLRLNPERNHPQMKARRQVVVMLALVVLSFFLCLLPLRVLFLWILLVPQKEIQDMGVEGYYNLVYFCRVMYYLNSCVNPILYAFMSTRFRSEFHKVLLCFRKRTKRKVDRNSFFTSSGPTGSVKRYSSYVPSLRGNSKKSKRSKDFTSSSSSGSSKLIRTTAIETSSSKPSSHKESFV